MRRAVLMPTQRVPSWFFFLCAGEGVIALAKLLSIPSEGVILSPARLILITIFLTLMVGCLYFGFRVQRAPRVLDIFSRPYAIHAAALLSLTFGLVLFLLRYLNPERFLSYYARLSPLLWYLFILSIQIAFFLLVRRNGFHPEALEKNKSLYIASVILFAILLFVLIFVSFTKLGITKDAVYWGEPGVPIPGWLFVFAILLGAGFLHFESKWSKPDHSRLLEILVPVLIWLVAATLWLGVPISSLKNSFYAPITAPYATPFPYSDAGFYDYLAQSLLVGTDYLGSIPPRPLYVTFLAFLHMLFGQDYVKIIAAQTMVLALFPVVLYWLGARIHSRAAGVLIAFFAIFRELTSLWISSETRTSVTKMFLTDFITALFIALVCLLTISWLERRDTKSAIIAGGTFGLLLLLRTQSLVILPFLIVLAWLAYVDRDRHSFKDWVQACVVFCVMLGLTIAPWVIRNYLATGAFALDYVSPTSVIYSQFSGETDPSDVLAEDNTGSSLFNLVIRNPGVVTGFVLNHFLNTQIGGLLALPLIARFDGLLAPINLYWMDWNGTLEWYNLLLIIFYLAVIALGMGAAWQRLKWIGLTPLAFSVGYALSNGIARFSSWRYNLPVDWVPFFYFGIGALEILSQASQLFGANTLSRLFVQRADLRSADLGKEMLKPTHLFFASAFVLIGALPWLAEGFASPRYMAQSVSMRAQEVAALSNAPSQLALETFASQPESFLETGRLLYPRFFARGKGIASANPWPAYQVRDYPRFGFMLLNQRITSAVFPSKNDPKTFPHAADAIILGCKREDYVEVRIIAFPDLNVVYTSAPLTEPCFP